MTLAGHGLTAPILTPEEVDRVRRPYLSASLLPGRAYHDPAIFEWERAEIFRRDWTILGRSEDVPEPGSYVVADLDGEPLVLVRGRDAVLRGFHNLCRHRGTAVVEEPCGKAVRFQCPYHAWIYDLDGTLVRAKHTETLEDFSLETRGLMPVSVAEWQGFIWASLDPAATSLEAWLVDLPTQWARYGFSRLRSVRQVVYEVDANWKFIAENYSECYHCPGIHPQLNRLTPYDLGGDWDAEGPWEGGWMELVDSAETMALGGGHRGERPLLCGLTPDEERQVGYYVLWPTTFVALHPDYLLVHRLVPTAASHTRVVCDWLFEAETMAMPGFDPSDTVEFWDVTNRQDWHVCELQQRGTASAVWDAGRYSSVEPSVHAFDLMVVDRYAGDGVSSRRAVRANYQMSALEDADAAAAVSGSSGRAPAPHGEAPAPNGRAAARRAVASGARGR